MVDPFDFVPRGAFRDEWPVLLSALVHTAIMCDPKLDLDKWAEALESMERVGATPELRDALESALSLICSAVAQGNLPAVAVHPRSKRHYDILPQHMANLRPRGHLASVEGPLQLEGLPVILEAARRAFGPRAPRIDPLFHVRVNRSTLDRMLWPRQLQSECRLVDADGVIHFPERMLELARRYAPEAAVHVDRLLTDLGSVMDTMNEVVPPTRPPDPVVERARTADAIRPHLADLARRYRSGEFASVRAAALELHRLVNTREDGSLVQPAERSYRTEEDVYRRLHDVARADPKMWPRKRGAAQTSKRP